MYVKRKSALESLKSNSRYTNESLLLEQKEDFVGKGLVDPTRR